MHILLYYLCKPTIKNKIVPICMVWHLGTIRQSISFLCSCERDLSYCLICVEIMNSSSFVSPEITTAEQRQTSFTNMMKVALGAEY